MGQSQPFSAIDDNAWLSNLVETFVRAEQLHDEPCDPAVSAATMARLQRPAVPRGVVTARHAKLLEFSV